MSRYNVIRATTPFLIQPDDINTDGHFFNSFDSYEREVSAKVVVKLMKQIGHWGSFTKAAIDEFNNENVWFNGLDTEGFIVKEGDSITSPMSSLRAASRPATGTVPWR